MPGEPLMYGRSHRWLWSLALAGFIILVMLLVACTDKVVAIGCPPVPPYPVEIQKQPAAELKALPPGAILRRFMDDYSRMRDQARECAKSG